MDILRFDGNGRMSQGVLYNNVLYLSGQTGDPDKDITGQAAEILTKIDNLLKKYGSDKSKLLTATIYLRDWTYFDSFNEVWDEWVEKGSEPTRACIEAKACRLGKLVEVVATAAL